MFQQVVIWGYKLYSHTHSYIHGAFFKAFQHLGYKTFWLDHHDDLSSYTFENTLFLTAGGAEEGIPVRNDAYYILHNCNMDKYKDVLSKQKLIIQVYTHDVINCHGGIPIEGHDGSFRTDSCLFIPWATDLLPEEIDQNINRDIISQSVVNFVGMMTNEWFDIKLWCEYRSIPFQGIGGFTDYKVNFSENMRLIQESLIAPAVQDQWQVEKGYIPCRIFKNISYGKMGMTNSAHVNELFGKRLIYHSNIHELMNMGLQFEQQSAEEKRKILIPLMEYVRDKHTYLNRIELILNEFKLSSQQACYKSTSDS